MDTEQINVLNEFIQLLHEADAQYKQIAFDVSGTTVITWFEIDDFDEASKRKIMVAETTANARMIGIRSDMRLRAMITEVRDGQAKPSPFARARAQAATH